jgi:hypothetical protein
MYLSSQLHVPAALAQEKRTQYSLNRRPSGSRASLDALQKRYVCALAGTEFRFHILPPQRPVIMPTTLSKFMTFRK